MSKTTFSQCALIFLFLVLPLIIIPMCAGGELGESACTADSASFEAYITLYQSIYLFSLFSIFIPIAIYTAVCGWVAIRTPIKIRDIFGAYVNTRRDRPNSTYMVIWGCVFGFPFALLALMSWKSGSTPLSGASPLGEEILITALILGFPFSFILSIISSLLSTFIPNSIGIVFFLIGLVITVALNGVLFGHSIALKVHNRKLEEDAAVIGKRGRTNS